MKNILITGGAGFIGSHLVDRLLAEGGFGITVVDDFNDFYDPDIKRENLRAALSNPNFKLVKADIRDRAALEKAFDAKAFDCIVHLAARAGVRPSLKEPRLYVETNINGTLNLLDLARAHGVKHFVFGSSSSVYGLNAKVPFSEADPIFNPISPYAATKLAGEALCHVYHHLYHFDVVCLRFFTVYGPRQRPDLAIRKFTEAILAGKPIDIYGDGSTRRDYTHIDDILQGMLACLERNFGYEIINLGESRTVELRELVRLIEKAAKKKAQIRQLPMQPGDVPETFADIDDLTRDVGFRPSTSIEDGIRDFVAWFRDHYKV